MVVSFRLPGALPPNVIFFSERTFFSFRKPVPRRLATWFTHSCFSISVSQRLQIFMGFRITVRDNASIPEAYILRTSPQYFGGFCFHCWRRPFVVGLTRWFVGGVPIYKLLRFLTQFSFLGFTDTAVFREYFIIYH